MYTRIRELREQMGMTQDELAKQVGVRRETIVFLEKGKYNPSLRLARDVARVFGTTMEDVFFFDDENLSGETDGPEPGN
ncbi:MAG: helix-turn-helix transcriptional regulator [Methanoregulaceae archaeon]